MRNAGLLRSGRVAEAYLDYIAEEIEDMAKRERRAMQSRVARLVVGTAFEAERELAGRDRRAVLSDSQAPEG